MLNLIDAQLASLGIPNPAVPFLEARFQKMEDGTIKVTTFPDGGSRLNAYFHERIPPVAVAAMTPLVSYSVRASYSDETVYRVNGERVNRSYPVIECLMSDRMRHAFGQPLDVLTTHLENWPDADTFRDRIRKLVTARITDAVIRDGRTTDLRIGKVVAVCPLCEHTTAGTYPQKHARHALVLHPPALCAEWFAPLCYATFEAATNAVLEDIEHDVLLEFAVKASGGAEAIRRSNDIE